MPNGISATTATRGSTPASKNVTSGTQPGKKHEADRLFLIDRPVRRPPWESADWWVRKANGYAPRDCGKNATHGPARLRYQTGFAGRSLAWSCQVCGWDLPVLVQEGANEPCAPSAPEVIPDWKLREQERMRERSRKNGQLGYRVREVAYQQKHEADVQSAVQKIEALLEAGSGILDLGHLKYWALGAGISRRSLDDAKQACGLKYRRSGVQYTWEGHR